MSSPVEIKADVLPAVVRERILKWLAMEEHAELRRIINGIITAELAVIGGNVCARPEEFLHSQSERTRESQRRIARLSLALQVLDEITEQLNKANFERVVGITINQ